MKLIEKAKEHITTTDPSHDIRHVFCVLRNAENICDTEPMADRKIVIASALFHDLVVYPKNSELSSLSAIHSAEKAVEILKQMPEFSQEKIDAVKNSISLCSFSKGMKADTLEAMILQDADALDSVGAITIMRTASSSGRMNRAFYDIIDDPFCNARKPNDMIYAFNLFYTRLLKIKERMNTKLGKQIAERRTEFLHSFLAELSLELEGK